jgi:hypothetical protein
MTDRFQINQQQEAEHWRRQLHEHALFTWWFAVQPALRARSEQLVRVGENLPSAEAVAAYAESLSQLHRTVRSQQASGAWEGFLYPTLVEHWADEEDLAARLVREPVVTVEETYRELAKDLAASSALIARMLDPVEAPMTEAFARRAMDFSMLATATVGTDASGQTNLGQNIGNLLQRAGEYAVLLASPELRAARKAMPPLLAEHDAREANHWSAILLAMTGGR